MTSVVRLITPSDLINKIQESSDYKKFLKSAEILKNRTITAVKQTFSLKAAERAARRNPDPSGPGQASYLSSCGKELAAPYRSGESPSVQEGVLQMRPSIPVSSHIDGDLSVSPDDLGINELTQTVVALGILHVMHSLISRSVDEAKYDLTTLSLNQSHSLWKMFYEKNKDISCFQWLKTRLFCFFFWEVQCLQKMIHAYVNNAVAIAQEEIVKNDRNRKQFLAALMKNISEILTVFNKETKTMVQSNVGENVSVYVDEILPKLSAHIKTKHSSLLHRASFLEKANAFLDKYPTHVSFRFGEKILNYIFLKVLKDLILPKVADELASSEPLIIAGIKQVILEPSRPHIAFHLTNVCVEQLQNVQREITDKPRDYLHSVEDRMISNLAMQLIETKTLLPCLSEPGGRIKKIRWTDKFTEMFFGPSVSDVLLSPAIQVAVTYLDQPKNVDSLFADLMTAARKVCIAAPGQINEVNANQQRIQALGSAIGKICVKAAVLTPS